jgi:DNA-binding CsgD family transcriptional regulator
VEGSHTVIILRTFIAERLFISTKTADHHIQHIYVKIGVSTRAAAALWAIQNSVLS